MIFRRIKGFFTSATGRLSLSYLLAMMLVSICFSLVFYFTSAHQLGRQLPPDALLNPHGSSSSIIAPDHQDGDKNGELGHFLNTRIDQGKINLQHKLLYLNLGALAIGSVLSYFLARRTLRPIERAMDAQVQFVNDASHELRTPVTAMMSSIDVTLREPKLKLADAKKVLVQNRNDLDRLQALSDGLLSLARNKKSEFVARKVNLQDIVAGALSQVVPQASSKQIAVHDEVANSGVLGNKAAIEQVLIILLDNAIKYSDKKSDICLKSRKKGKFIYVDVIDKGIGIKPEDLHHLFKRFYRADQARSHTREHAHTGYGLGLSIAARIMENHGSSIHVSSEVGEGSTFSLKLKVAN